MCVQDLCYKSFKAEAKTHLTILLNTTVILLPTDYTIVNSSYYYDFANFEKRLFDNRFSLAPLPESATYTS
jgi:hypothetical protein